MKLTFNDIINTHRDRVGLSVATGPSLKPHLNTIIDLSNSNYETIFNNTNINF